MSLTVETDAGTIDYIEIGPPTGRPVVFVHGYWMGPEIWHEVSGLLAATGLRCIAPTWPLGGHRRPLRSTADRGLAGMARTVAGVLTALELKDVVLVGNDSGGLITQLVAVHHPERLSAIALTSCDAFENFPPPSCSR